MRDDSLLNSFNISSSALSAERTRLNIIASNIANINTTRTESGGPYRKKEVVFETLLKESAEEIESDGGYMGQGVKVAEIKEDQSPFKRVYDPTHPDADKSGYLSLPNVNVTEEMVDLISASRAYEANVAVVQATKAMVNKSLEIGR